MNIFVLDTDPQTAAAMHCDKHVVKMSVEYAQLLSAAHHIHLSPVRAHVYRLTHQHHPATRWVAQHASHYDWVWQLATACWAEYTQRYGRCHRSSQLSVWLQQNPVRGGEPMLPPQCMPDACRVESTTWAAIVHAYRKYYRTHKLFARWAHSHPPDWWV